MRGPTQTLALALSLSSTVLGAACKAPWVKSKEAGEWGNGQYGHGTTADAAEPSRGAEWGHGSYPSASKAASYGGDDEDGQGHGGYGHGGKPAVSSVSKTSSTWGHPGQPYASPSYAHSYSSSVYGGHGGYHSQSAPAAESSEGAWPSHSHSASLSHGGHGPSASSKTSSAYSPSGSHSRSAESSVSKSSSASVSNGSSSASVSKASSSASESKASFTSSATMSESSSSVDASKSSSSSVSSIKPSSSSAITSSVSSSSSFSASSSVASSSTSSAPVSSTTCGGKTYIYNELAGWGVLPGNARDQVGDTLGGIGSGIAIDRSSWRKEGDSYKFVLYGLPDRGWNTEGTLNYQSRIQKFHMTFTPATDATVSNPSSPNLVFDLQETVLLTDPAGVPTTGLNADEHDFAEFAGFPKLPQATYQGNGFGDAGSGGVRVSVDAEGLFLGHDGTYWVSDEYGPNLYHFSQTGKMLSAFTPVDAVVPLRNGSTSFTTDDVFNYNKDFTIDPVEPTQGRDNNKGLEGLTVDPTGTFAYGLLQSAGTQEGGLKKTDRRYVRLHKWNLATGAVVGEWVVALPVYTDTTDDNKLVVAEESEIHYVSDTQFLILTRDKGRGHGQTDSTSLYRHVDVFDISAATNIIGTYDAFNQSIASTKGKLKDAITPATLCSFVDFNLNSQLNRFGAHNGGAQDAGLLNEKWESLALMPAEKPDEYYLFAVSDNDFITQDGYMNGGQLPYSDATGFNLDNQALIFKVTLPSGSAPLVS